MATESRLRANARYAAKAYEQLKISVPRGYKARIKAAADARRLSMRQFLIDAIDSKIVDN